MSKIGMVERQFQGYLNLVYTNRSGMGSSQETQLRQAFFAGASMYQGLVMGNLSDENGVTPADEAAMEAITQRYMDELEDFAERCVTGMAPPRGSA